WNTTGALPPGLHLEPTTGAITGTPNTSGTTNLTITTTDSSGTTVALNAQIQVQPGLPVPLLGVTTIKTALGNGLGPTYALTADGGVWAWGDNTYGELGNGTTTTSFTPVPVQGITGIQSIAAGYQNAYAVKGDGTVWAWGRNIYAQSGYQTQTNSSVPVQITGVTNAQSVVVNDAAADNFSGSQFSVYVLTKDGTVLSWGRNWDGQLGDGSYVDSSAPVQVQGLTGVTSLAAGGGSDNTGTASVFAVRNDGTVWAWGDNQNGQLGNGTTSSSPIPIQIPGLTGVQSITTDELSPTSYPSFSVYALKSDGTLLSWGSNLNGALGDGTTVEAHTPTQVQGISGITQVVAGMKSVYGLKSDGTIWAWGYDGHGQLGNGSLSDSYVPIKISNISGVNQISCNYDSTAFAVKSDGTAWAWGNAGTELIGNGAISDQTTPAQVATLSGVQSLTVSDEEAYAFISDKTVSMWGMDSTSIGQLVH
ncbi:hypothetical protein BMF89_08335, partial [Arthrobacter sp. SRS-W-1-2016]|uniref:RCC1 domain-containing protein n=1 Tax=Arthrobacter sp. SRS-W-1-2016 TaxID=1930254 RepID=UPI0009D3E345